MRPAKARKPAPLDSSGRERLWISGNGDAFGGGRQHGSPHPPLSPRCQRSPWVTWVSVSTRTPTTVAIGSFLLRLATGIRRRGLAVERKVPIMIPRLDRESRAAGASHGRQGHPAPRLRFQAGGGCRGWEDPQAGAPQAADTL